MKIITHRDTHKSDNYTLPKSKPLKLLHPSEWSLPDPSHSALRRGCEDVSADGLNEEEASSSVCGAKLLLNCASAELHHVGAWLLCGAPKPGSENKGPLVWHRLEM